MSLNIDFLERFNSKIIITGEKCQQLCDIYLGNIEDLHYNPVIKNQTYKHLLINNINDDYDNPYKIFCYSHLIPLFSQKIQFFKNNFVLITHNSDFEIYDTEQVQKILNNSNLVKWYGQNVCFDHPKLYLLPIGFANSMWPHGNLSLFDNDLFINSLSQKSKKVYFNFSIHTNETKRQKCYKQLKDMLEWIPNVSPSENLNRLKQYEFCICPEGNGVDNHRLWESLYLKVVPVVIKSDFTNILIKNNITDPKTGNPFYVNINNKVLVRGSTSTLNRTQLTELLREKYKPGFVYK